MKKLKWAEWASLLISLGTIVFPYLFMSLFPNGLLDYFLFSIPLGIIAIVLAIIGRNPFLAMLGCVAIAAPFLGVFLLTIVGLFVQLITFGHISPEDWLFTPRYIHWH